MKNRTADDISQMSDGQIRALYGRLCKAEAQARKTGNDYKLAEVSEQVSVVVGVCDKYNIPLEA